MKSAWCRIWTETLLAGVLMMVMTACATTNGAERIYHGLSLKVDNTISKVKNIRYQYGVLGKNKLIPIAASPGAFSTEVLNMPVPEYFEITWETLDGIKHEATVPVLGHLPRSIKDKTVLFVIMGNTVQGFIQTLTPYGPKLERFY